MSTFPLRVFPFISSNLVEMLKWVQVFITSIVNFVFLGSKSLLSSKNKPYVCGVYDFEIPDLCLKGRLFYPSKRSTLSSSPGAPWFTQPIAEVVYGKLVFWLKPETGSLVVQFLVGFIYYLLVLIPQSLLPTLPNTLRATGHPEIAFQEKNELPLIVWSHGKGGNVHDHALMLSQMAVEVPAICVAVTHTDGSADSWRNARNRASFYRHSLFSGQDECFLKEFVEMQEYQATYRVSELENIVAHVRQMGVKFDKIIVGGFDLGGATAVLAGRQLNAAGVVTIDGSFALDDRFKFPRSLFALSGISQPVAYLMSDEYQVCNKAIADNTSHLISITADHKVITVKQTKHYNFIECMYWIPQISLIVLRMSGLIHRRACPRKTYRRSVKWLVALIQQFNGTNS